MNDLQLQVAEEMAELILFWSKQLGQPWSEVLEELRADVNEMEPDAKEVTERFTKAVAACCMRLTAGMN